MKTNTNKEEKWEGVIEQLFSILVKEEIWDDAGECGSNCGNGCSCQETERRIKKEFQQIITTHTHTEERVREEREEGFMEGLRRHTWMKDGTTYVGNGTYTLKEAIESAKKDGLLTTPNPQPN